MQEELNLPKKDKDRDVLFKNISFAFNSNEKIYALGLYFEPNAIDGKDKEFKGKGVYSTKTGRFACYIYNDNGKKTAISLNEIDDNSTNEFYTNGISKGEVFLGEPSYEDINGVDVLMISYNIPY